MSSTMATAFPRPVGVRLARCLSVGSRFPRRAVAEHYHGANRRRGVASDPPRHDDDGNYTWPNLYEEAHDMMMASCLSYPMTHVLREARAGRLKDSGGVLEKLRAIGDGDLATAVTPQDFLAIVRDNKEEIAASYPMESDLRFGWYKVLQHYEQQQYAEGDNVQFMEFDDQQETTRLVYGIGVNHKHKRITVVFRGTYAEGTSDWSRNLQFQRVRVPVPKAVRAPEDMAETTILLHRGIYEYLLRNSERGEDYPRERYEEIVRHLRAASAGLPGYKIYATGHSMGGALAALLSFYATADDRLPQPITCVSLGALLVGDHGLRAAVRAMEASGRLRHLRITNEHDPVPSFPPFGWYQPFGVHLRLAETTGHTLSYDSCGDEGSSSSTSTRRFGELWRSYRRKGFSLDRWVASHSVPEHLQRLEREKVGLDIRYLNEFYDSHPPTTEGQP